MHESQLELPPASKIWTSTSVRWHNLAPITFHGTLPGAVTPVLGGEQPPYCSSHFHADRSWEPANPSSLPPSLHELVQNPNRAATPGQEAQAAIPTGGFWRTPLPSPPQEAEEQAAVTCEGSSSSTYRELSQPHLFVVAATARLQAAASCGLSSPLAHNIAFSSPRWKQNKSGSHRPLAFAFPSSPAARDRSCVPKRTEGRRSPFYLGPRCAPRPYRRPPPPRRPRGGAGDSRGRMNDLPRRSAGLGWGW